MLFKTTLIERYHGVAKLDSEVLGIRVQLARDVVGDACWTLSPTTSSHSELWTPSSSSTAGNVRAALESDIANSVKAT